MKLKRKYWQYVILILVIIAIILISDYIENYIEKTKERGKLFTKSYKEFLPKEIANLSEDFYPANLTRGDLLAKVPSAINKTGGIGDDVWSGIILVTGDINAVNLVIEPGTIIFVKAHYDDQHGGGEDGPDAVNPHEFFGENYSKNHIDINIGNELNAKGTHSNPIIFTSTAEKPYLNDWRGLSFTRGTLEYVVLEYAYTISLRSSYTSISHCLIRNMLASGAMFGTWPEMGIYGESVSPNITYNYVYNFGHMAVQSFFSEPYIANNIFIHKNTNDPELYNYLNKGENGGLDIHGGNGTIEYNFLSYGYTAGLEKESLLGGPGIVITEATAPVISFNTIVGNRWGIELQGGTPIVNNNNIYANTDGNLAVRSLYTEPGKENQSLAYDMPIDFRQNWWGTSDKNELTNGMNIDKDIDVDLDPICTSAIPNACPNWKEFEWLYK